jgi:hypothetical protein
MIPSSSSRRALAITFCCAFTTQAHAGLMAWWKFDEAAGTTAVDNSGSAITANLVGGATFQPAAGRFGGAVYTNGTTGFVEAPDRTELEFSNTQSFTLALWVKPDGDEATAAGEWAGGLNQGLMTKGYPGTSYNNNYYQLQITVPASGAVAPANTQSWFVFDSRESSALATAFRFPAAYTLPDAVTNWPNSTTNNNTWHHVVNVFDRATAQSRMYVDGSIYASKAIAATAGNGGWAMGVNTSTLVIGNHQNRYCRAWFDDVGIWNNALTATEVTTIYNNGINGLVGTDTDNDGLPDPWEIQYFTNLAQTAAGDPDSDGLTNAQEFATGTNPALADTDNDGLTDGQEKNTYLTNPLVADSDGDTLSDGAEVNTYLTNPLKQDTDGDNWKDNEEVAAGTNPNSAASRPPAAVGDVHINEFVHSTWMAMLATG